ncbi:hypothetical protein ES703_106052 [subsurface metagenome]
MSNNDKLLGSDGMPLTTQPSIVVIKSRNPLPPQLIQNIGVVTKSSVVVLPLEIDLMMGKLAMEEIEAIHGAIHDILGIEEKK